MFCYFVFCWICFFSFFLIPSVLRLFDCLISSLLVFICITCLFVYSFFSNSFNLKCSAFQIRFDFSLSIVAFGGSWIHCTLPFVSKVEFYFSVVFLRTNEMHMYFFTIKMFQNERHRMVFPVCLM